MFGQDIAVSNTWTLAAVVSAMVAAKARLVAMTGQGHIFVKKEAWVRANDVAVILKHARPEWTL